MGIQCSSNSKMRNSEGYLDPTFYLAMKNIETEEKKKNQEFERYHNLISTIVYICKIAGFEIQGRIVLKDKRNGRIWK